MRDLSLPPPTAPGEVLLSVRCPDCMGVMPSPNPHTIHCRTCGGHRFLWRPISLLDLADELFQAAIRADFPQLDLLRGAPIPFPEEDADAEQAG